MHTAERRYIAGRGDRTTVSTSGAIRTDKTPSGKLCMLGFAFERKPSGSSLTSGEAKNLRALHEYPSSAGNFLDRQTLYFLYTLPPDFPQSLAIPTILCYTNLERRWDYEMVKINIQKEKS